MDFWNKKVARMGIYLQKVILSVISLIVLAALLGVGSSCMGYIVGSGPIISKEFGYTGFTNVEISSFFQFEINHSDSYSVTASTYENIIDYLDISQSGKTLVVRFKTGRYNMDTKVTITMPELNRLEVSGASRGSVKGFKSADQFDLKVSGASQLNMNVETGETKMDISGAGKVTGNLKAQDTWLNVSGASHCEINGSAGLVNIEVSGASHFDSPDFQMQNTNINVSGASHATIYTKGTLNVDASGASTLDYLGNPILSKVNVNGASKINSR